ncbi:MAG: leucine-rich repeat domain-containing protein [Oscillospiraceae bacterium]|nr:leucine-rich repeat domain-containing protein [Oscillospiraceae bacterium]
MFGNRVSIMGNRGFYFVEFLNLNFNEITDISFLGRLRLPSLQILDINNNNITSFSSLRSRNLPSIERIDFWSNNISEREAAAVTRRLNLQEHPGFG